MPLEILTYPDPRLRVKCRPVTTVDDGVRSFAAELGRAMYAGRGIGLAASQVGDERRIIVIDVPVDDEGRTTGLMTLINPELTACEGECEGEEGCLSIPGVTENVVRHERISVRYLDLEGGERTIEASDLVSVCIQHEMDHLDGVLFTDRLSRLKRALAQRRTIRFQQSKKEEENDRRGGL